MTAVFVHVPEQQAGHPLSFAEAIEHLATMAVLLVEKSPSNGPNASDWGEALLRAGLLSCAPAYVRSPSSGRYVRLPTEYWASLTAGEIPPALFGGMETGVGWDSDMIGQPLVIWRDDLEPLIAVLADLSCAAGGSPSAMTAPEQVRKSLGRPRGTENYTSDRLIVDRVIRLCDEGAHLGKASVRSAIKSMISEIEPPWLEDDRKIRRIRDKVLKERPDLRD